MNMKNRKGTKKDYSRYHVRIKAVDEHKKVYLVKSGTIARFTSFCSRRKYQSFDVLVWYGKQRDCFGKMVMFDNQYIGKSKGEAVHALLAFLE